MTTIAYRDGALACDTMEVHTSEAGGSRYFVNSEKIFELEDGYLGSSGDSAGVYVWFEYHQAKSSKQKETQLEIMAEYDFDIVWMASDGLWVSDQTGVISQCHEPYYAIGSGSKAAMAAMICGKSAEAAVDVAALVDPYTGGEVKVYRL